MAQSRTKDIEEKEEARKHKKAPEPLYGQRKQAAVPEDRRVDPAEAVLNLQRSYGNRYVQRVMGKVQARLIVNPPDDEYEREADRVADVVTRAPASSVQCQAATTAEAKTPEAGAGVDKARLAALKMMFEAAVVGPMRKAYEVMGGDKPDAQAGFNHLQTSYEVLVSMCKPYKGVEPMYSRLILLVNTLNVWGAQLRPHVGRAAIPLSKIREDFNPDKNTILKAIRSQF